MSSELPTIILWCIETFFGGIGEELSNYNSTEEDGDAIFGIFKDPTCAAEIKSVCSNDEVLTNCGGSDYIDCPYLNCFIDAYAADSEVEECYCLQYRLTCDRYAGTDSPYALYVEQYCTIADCCDAQPVGSKASTCIPDDDEIDEIIDTIVEETIIPDMIDEIFDFPTEDNEEDYLPEGAVPPQGQEEAQDDAPKDDMSTTTDMPAETEEDEEEILPTGNTPEDVGSDMPAQTEGGDEIPSDNTAEEDVTEPTSTVSEEEEGEEEDSTSSVNSDRIISAGMTLVALAFYCWSV